MVLISIFIRVEFMLDVLLKLTLDIFGEDLLILLLICIYNPGNQLMPHHIADIKSYKVNAFDVFQDFNCLNESRILISWQIDLRNITCNNKFRGPPHAGNKHF